MRKFLISAAVAATALTAAVPAAAQYAPPYGNAYGFNNYGQVRSLQTRVDRLQREIRRLDQRNILSNREAAKLLDDSRDLERRLARSSRNGLNRNEVRAVEVRLVRLEQRLQHDARDGNRWGDRRNGDRDYADRDRDGRNDRYEDDHGTRHD
jgi:predicted RNase H-like nuclease (RuvC/YqgF family)